MKEADARFRLKRLEAAMSRRSATDERVIVLKRAMKQFVKSQAGTASERGLRRAFLNADVDHSGELDYVEFKDAVRNYGLRHLSVGSLRTLFDSFDSDGSGSISHSEFVESLASVTTYEQARRATPLAKPVLSEPKRMGFEATPPTLKLGQLYVSVVYEAALTVVNAGDVDLRLMVKVEGFDGARDKNPVRVVQRPRGNLPPGLKTRIVLQVSARAPASLDVDIVVTSDTQEVVVPLTATLIRRPSLKIATSQQGSNDDLPLPKYARRVEKPCSVWPSLAEQWECVQMQTDEAGKLLFNMPVLDGCPVADVRAVAIRLKRVSIRAGATLYEAPYVKKTPRHMFFIAVGRAEIFADYTLKCALDSPFYVGESSVLSVEGPPVASTVIAAANCEGFSLAHPQAADLVAKGNRAIALIRRDLAQRRFEHDCAQHGGLLLCNYQDDAFVAALLDFARKQTRHEAKASFLVRLLKLTDRCLEEIDTLDDILSALDKTDDQIRTDRTLAFDRCLVVADSIWADFVGTQKRLSKALGANVMTPERFDSMVRVRRQALTDASFDLLYKIFEPLRTDIIAQIDKVLLPDFATSQQYATWILDRFPLQAMLPKSTTDESSTKSSRRDSRRHSLDYVRLRAHHDVNHSHDPDAHRPKTANDALPTAVATTESRLVHTSHHSRGPRGPCAQAATAYC